MRLLTFSLLLMALVATVGLGWLFDGAIEQYRLENNDDKQHKDINAVAVLEQLGSELTTTINQLPQPQQQQFVDAWPKQPYALTMINIERQPLPQPLLDQVKQGQPLLIESSNHLAFYYYLPGSNQLLTLKSPLLLISPAQDNQNYLFTLLFYTALLLLLLLWASPLIRRLVTLRRAAQHFGHGNLSQRISLSRFSYISDIEIEFNRMAGRIENLVDDVKLLSSAVSHDLRTPLARIRFGIDTLEEEDDPILRQRYQKRISDNVDEMAMLVDTLLRYARLDQTMLQIKRQSIDISALITHCIDMKQCEEVTIELTKDSQQHYVHGDKTYLIMMFNNLLQNAINYGKTSVRVTLLNESDQLKIIVEDDGLGIPEAQRDNMFKPFVRGSFSNNNHGHGMGLAIVKRILDWHEGTIHIEDSTALNGAKFVLTLPKR